MNPRMINISQYDVYGIEWESKAPGLKTYFCWEPAEVGEKYWIEVNKNYRRCSKAKINALDIFIKLHSKYLHHNYQGKQSFFYWRKIDRYQLDDILSAKTITVPSNISFLGRVFDVYMMLYYFVEKEVLYLQ
jgi:hypothetical protein